MLEYIQVEYREDFKPKRGNEPSQLRYLSLTDAWHKAQFYSFCRLELNSFKKYRVWPQFKKSSAKRQAWIWSNSNSNSNKLKLHKVQLYLLNKSPLILFYLNFKIHYIYTYFLWNKKYKQWIMLWHQRGTHVQKIFTYQ